MLDVSFDDSIVLKQSESLYHRPSQMLGNGQQDPGTYKSPIVCMLVGPESYTQQIS